MKRVFFVLVVLLYLSKDLKSNDKAIFNSFTRKEKMLKMLTQSSISTVDSERNGSGYSKILFFKDIISPFRVIDINKENYTVEKLPNIMINLYKSHLTSSK